MFSLILKDILVSKKILLFGAAFITLMTILGVPEGAKDLAAGAIIVGVVYMGMVLSSSADETNKADILLNSLPLKRYEIVLAKYISIFVYSAIGILFYLLFEVLIKVTGVPVVVYPITFKSIAYGFLLVSFLNSLYLTLMFKFGYNISRVFYIFFFVFFFLSISYVEKLVGKFAGSSWLQNISSFIMSQSDVVKMFFIIVFAFILLTISYLLSVRFYENREF